jgi:hypothetical protein
VPWRTFAALALGAVVAVVVAAGVLAVGRGSSPEPPGVIRLRPGPTTTTVVGAVDGEGLDAPDAAVIVPPPVHLQPTPTPPPPPVAPVPAPAPAPVPLSPAADDDDLDDLDDDEADEPDDDEDDD